MRVVVRPKDWWRAVLVDFTHQRVRLNATAAICWKKWEVETSRAKIALRIHQSRHLAALFGDLQSLNSLASIRSATIRKLWTGVTKGP